MSSWIPGDPIMTQLVENPVALAAIAVASLAAAYVFLPRVSALWRTVSVKLGLSKSSQDKVYTFMNQHAKNMREAEKEPSYAFSIIESPVLASAAHSIAVGILPNDSLLADVKRSKLTKAADGSVRPLAVLSVVEQFELDTQFDYTFVPAAPSNLAHDALPPAFLHDAALNPPCVRINSPLSTRAPLAHACGRSLSGQQQRFKSFASSASAGAFKQRSLFPCDDYCAVPLPVLHQAADQLHRYLSDGMAVYVHCKSGKGRSACAVCAYLMKHQVSCDTQCVSNDV